MKVEAIALAFVFVFVTGCAFVKPACEILLKPEWAKYCNPESTPEPAEETAD